MNQFYSEIDEYNAGPPYSDCDALHESLLKKVDSFDDLIKMQSLLKEAMPIDV